MKNSQVFDFLSTHMTCVLARTNLGQGVSAATVGFSVDEELQFVIATNRTTRKYEDIRKNPNCAIVVGFEMPITVQLEGVAQEVSADELGDRLETHFNKVPAARRLAGDDQAYFLIKPTWLRYRNLTDETQTFETKDFA
jgi:uncharacterized pyridoxamine 5'-phosphate oxidase family protein